MLFENLCLELATPFTRDAVVGLLFGSWREIRTKLDEQAKKLGIIEQHLAIVRSEPLQSAVQHLQTASMIIADVELQEQLINDARRDFVKAASVDNTGRAWLAKLSVGVCFDLLQQGEAARAWYRKAYLDVFHRREELSVAIKPDPRGPEGYDGKE